jgi:hypothetical protein
MLHQFTQAGDSIEGIGTYTGNLTQEQQENPLFQVHNPASNDVALAYKIAEDMINVNGAAVLVHLRTDNEDIDGVHDEDADPTYWPPKSGLKAFFVPQPVELELTNWGVDVAKNTAEIVFSRNSALAMFGDRLLRPGDLIEVPYNSVSRIKPKYYRVENAQETGNFRYNWMHLTCQTVLMTGDVHLRPATDQADVFEEYSDPDMVDEAL